jgi:hypothetical protein
MSEACLTINVIRGSSVDENSKLPVGVWIHGGGFYMGSGSDERYNMSAIVANSYEIGKPYVQAQERNLSRCLPVQANHSLPFRSTTVFLHGAS